MANQVELNGKREMVPELGEPHPIDLFLRECCQDSEGSKIQSSKFYRAYNSWAKARNYPPYNQNVVSGFIQAQRKYRIETGTSRYRFIIGLNY